MFVYCESFNENALQWSLFILILTILISGAFLISEGYPKQPTFPTVKHNSSGLENLSHFNFESMEVNRNGKINNTKD